MPYGLLYSTDDFYGTDCEKITPKLKAEVIDQVIKGYAERLKEINEGMIETADNVSINQLAYAQKEGVYPLEDDGKKKDPKKAENKYSNYKCFTI